MQQHWASSLELCIMASLYKWAHWKTPCDYQSHLRYGFSWNFNSHVPTILWNKCLLSFLLEETTLQSQVKILLRKHKSKNSSRISVLHSQYLLAVIFMGNSVFCQLASHFLPTSLYSPKCHTFILSMQLKYNQIVSEDFGGILIFAFSHHFKNDYVV